MWLSFGPCLGLRKPSVNPDWEALFASSTGGGAAGNLNSGIGLGDILGDLRCPMLDVSGEPGIRPNRSGGYDELGAGELVCR